jgi:hypothetical protein
MRIPLPERGQPIDLNYLYQIANAVNDLNTRVATADTTSIVDNGIQLPENVTTSNLRFYGTAAVNIAKPNVTAGTSDTWSVTFNSDFLYTPVVTATVRNNTSSTAGNNITLVIKNVTTGSVDGNIIYNERGSIDININVIAIGVSR